MPGRIDKYACVGPGGVHCPCCFPAPGSNERKLEFRRAKRREMKEAFRVEEINMREDDNG
jgi:hypothetical protein